MFAELLKKLALSLEAAGFPYMVIGGQAVLVYGEPRLTKDIDISLGVFLDRLPDLVSLAERNGLAVLVNPNEFTTKTMVLPCLEPDTGIRVDFMFSWSEYEKQAMARSRSIELDGIPVKFASLEDLIIHKIIAGRPRDLEDVRLLLMKNSEVDFQYIRVLLQEFDTALGEGFAGRFHSVWQESRQPKNKAQA